MNEPQTPAELFSRLQQQWLLPCAVHESDSGGRRHPQDEHGYRSCYQRDRDRVVHSSAFRRLDFKTQVFVPHENDHFRTRLTHTLEVAQIGRTLARALRCGEDVVEVVALAHDLGHPPFGHAGEAALDSLMADHGRFEHNRQSLRVVDYLEHPYPHFRGLNLTSVVRECIARHTSRYDTPICEDFPPGLRAPIEGQLVDLCDEIAYTSADLEDALAAGWVTTEQLAAEPLWQRAWAVAQADCPDAREVHKRIRACKAVLACLADDLVATTAGNIARLGPKTLDEVRRAPRAVVAFSPAIRAEASSIQKFLYDNVYTCPAGVKKEQTALRVITQLFGTYVENPSLLPARYQSRIDSDGLHRVVCDYIAGMTDRFCREEHARLCW